MNKKIYTISSTLDQEMWVDASYPYHLPKIACAECSPEYKSWGNGNFEYPAFKFDFLNEADFCNKKVLSVKEFELLKEKLISAAGEPVVFVPGGSIGELTGKTTRKNLDDFIWGRLSVPQVSKKARDVLVAEGIHFLTADLCIRFRGQKIESHLAIQAKIAPLLTQRSLARFTIKHCPHCGGYKKLDRRIKAPIGVPFVNDIIIPEGYEIDSSLWPQGKHIVQSEETLEIFVSSDFMDAVKRHNFTGIRFIECGRMI